MLNITPDSQNNGIESVAISWKISLLIAPRIESI